MIRFPNPGSDMDSFIRIFQILHSELNDKSYFTLDDMSEKLTNKNLVSSQGYMGEEALKRSVRKDRSRDPVYNQSKMYAELYRILGWVQSDENKRLNFVFTYLGDHMANAQLDPLSLFKECILGINYPNAIIDVKSDKYLRPFAAILKSMYDLDGYICRDEMIIGPLSIDDLINEEYTSSITKIKNCRPLHKKLIDELTHLSEKLNIQINTLGNYTRFPISVLEYCSWIIKERTKSIYTDKKLVFLKLTDGGEKIVRFINDSIDIRYNKVPKEVDFRSLVRVSFFQMLARGGFEIDSIQNSIEKDLYKLQNHYDESSEYLFSPYQTYEINTVNEALANYIPQNKNVNTTITNLLEKYGDYSSNGKNTTYFITLNPHESIIKIDNSRSEFVKQVLDLHKSYAISNEIINRMYHKYKEANKDVFYNLIVELLTILGYDCSATRYGINYERWDAMISDPSHSIPIEIKSPTEEEYLSVKAIRQALENKIILLSRNSYPTDYKTVSLAIGYNSPNYRSDVSQLIEDIYNAFGINIGVIDFRTLLNIVVKTITEKKSINLEDLRNTRGIINVKDF